MVLGLTPSAANAAEMVYLRTAGPCATVAAAFVKRLDLQYIDTNTIEGYVQPPCIQAPCGFDVMVTTRSGRGAFDAFRQLDADERRCVQNRVEIRTPPDGPLHGPEKYRSLLPGK